MNRSVNFTVRLNREEEDALERLAREHGLYASGVLRVLLRAAAGLPVPSWASKLAA